MTSPRGKIYYAVTFTLMISAGLVFENCSHIAPPVNIYVAPTTGDLPFNHPDVDINLESKVASGQIVMGDRFYLESAFVDIFGPADASSDIQGFVQAVISQEFGPVQHTLGRACDPYVTGDSSECYGAKPNVETRMNAQSSSMREAARIQICRRLLANDTELGYLISRLNNGLNGPTDASVTAAIQLFYPARDSALSVKESLLLMDKELSAKSESINDRWRLIFLTLCESPDWQVL